MYSHEIQKIMEDYGYHLPSRVYLGICGSSRQIRRIHYDGCGDFFEIWTNDGHYWKFTVYLAPDGQQPMERR